MIVVDFTSYCINLHHRFRKSKQVHVFGTVSYTHLDVYKRQVPVNIAGLPAISVPCGQGSDGMPVGMQLIGAAFSEARILNAAYQFECAAGESVRQPYGSGVQL